MPIFKVISTPKAPQALLPDGTFPSTVFALSPFDMQKFKSISGAVNGTQDMALIRNIDPVRVVVFGGAYHAVAVAGKIIELERRFPGRITLVGVVANTDERGKVGALAAGSNVPVRREDISTQLFYDTLAEEWQPTVGYRVGFQQNIPQAVLDFPRLGFYGFAPVAAPIWPPAKAVSDNSFQPLIASRAAQGSLALRQILDEEGQGDLIGFSKPFAVASNEDETTLNMNTADIVGQMVEGQLAEYIGAPHQDYAALGYAAEPRALKRAS
jgi:methionyl-tRNA formyltransferase